MSYQLLSEKVTYRNFARPVPELSFLVAAIVGQPVLVTQLNKHPVGELHPGNTRESGIKGVQVSAAVFDLTRENLMKQATSIKDATLDVTLPGIRYNTGPNDYFLVEQLQLARFDGKRWVLFGEVIGHE